MLRRRIVLLLMVILGNPGAIFLPTCAAADLPEPRLVTQTGEATVSELVAVLSRQGGVTVEPGDIDADRKVKVTWAKTPFWVALDDLASQVGARIEITNGGRLIRLKSSPMRAPVAVAGPFRFAAKSVLSRLDLETGVATYDLGFDLKWEPRLKVYRIDAYPKIVQATDDRGIVLTTPTIKARSAVVGSSANLSMRLNGLTGESRSIALLKGELQATVADELLTFTLAPGEEKRQSGVKVSYTIKEQSNGSLLTVTMDYGRELPEFESFESWTGENTAELVLDGKAIPLTESEVLIGSEGVYTVRYRVSQIDDLKKRKLVYTTPSALREVTIPFTLQDIRLP